MDILVVQFGTFEFSCTLLAVIFTFIISRVDVMTFFITDKICATTTALTLYAGCTVDAKFQVFRFDTSVIVITNIRTYAVFVVTAKTPHEMVAALAGMLSYTATDFILPCRTCWKCFATSWIEEAGHL